MLLNPLESQSYGIPKLAKPNSCFLARNSNTEFPVGVTPTFSVKIPVVELQRNGNYNTNSVMLTSLAHVADTSLV